MQVHINRITVRPPNSRCASTRPVGREQVISFLPRHQLHPGILHSFARKPESEHVGQLSYVVSGWSSNLHGTVFVHSTPLQLHGSDDLSHLDGNWLIARVIPGQMPPHPRTLASGRARHDFWECESQSIQLLAPTLRVSAPGGFSVQYLGYIIPRGVLIAVEVALQIDVAPSREAKR